MNNFEFLSMDLLITIILFILLLLVAFKFGKKILISLIVSMYPTLLIFANLDFEKFNMTEKTSQAILFIILYALLTTILWKNINVKKVVTRFRKIVDYSVLSLTYILLLISIYMNSVDYLSPFYTFSGITTQWVAKIPYSFVLIIPIIVILITNRKDLER